MYRILLNCLLSLALMIQGVGQACATMVGQGMDGGADTAMAMHAGSDQDGCGSCPDCPDQQQHQHGSDCAPGCTTAAAIFPAAPVVLAKLAASPTQLAAKPSLVELLGPPPTPPPIS